MVEVRLAHRREVRRGLGSYGDARGMEAVESSARGHAKSLLGELARVHQDLSDRALVVPRRASVLAIGEHD